MITEENCLWTIGHTKSWYTRVKQKLLKLNVKVSKYDAGSFISQYRGTLHELLVTPIADFLWGGLHAFIENVIIVIKPLHKNFET